MRSCFFFLAGVSSSSTLELFGDSRFKAIRPSVEASVTTSLVVVGCCGLRRSTGTAPSFGISLCRTTGVVGFDTATLVVGATTRMTEEPIALVVAAGTRPDEPTIEVTVLDGGVALLDGVVGFRASNAGIKQVVKRLLIR